MAEFRFHIKRLWRSKVFLFAFAFILIYTSVYFYQIKRQQGMVDHYFSFDATQGLRQNIEKEKEWLLASGRVELPIDEATAEEFPVFQLEAALFDADLAMLERDRMGVVNHMARFYDIYDTAYLENQPAGMPRFIQLTPSELAFREMFLALNTQAIPYEDTNYSLQSVHLMNHMGRVFSGYPLVLFSVFVAVAILVRDDTKERQAFRKLQPIPLWMQFALEIAGAALLILLGFVLLQLFALICGITVGDGIGHWNYPIAVFGQQATVTVVPLWQILIQRFLRIIPVAIAIPSLALFLRTVLKDGRIVLIILAVIGGLLQYFAIHTQVHQQLAMELQWIPQLFNPMLAPYGANFASTLRLPVIGTLVSSAYLFVISLLLAVAGTESKRLQNLQWHTRRKNVVRALEKEPNHVDRLFPNVRFQWKKLMQSQTLQTVVIVACGIVLVSFFTSQGTYYSRIEELGNRIHQEILELQQTARHVRDPRILRDTETLKELRQLYQKDREAAVLRYERFLQDREFADASFYQIQLYSKWFLAIEEGQHRLPLALGGRSLPMTLFDYPATQDQEYIDILRSDRVLNDITYIVHGHFKNQQLLLVIALILVTLASGISHEVGRKRTIDFLHTQPVKGRNLFASFLTTQWIYGLLSLVLVLGMGVGLLAVTGSTNDMQQPALKYTLQSDEGMDAFPTKELTIMQLNPKNTRSTETIGVFFESMGGQNMQMMGLTVLLVLLVIALAMLLSFAMKNALATGVLAVVLLVVGGIVMKTLALPSAWISPMIWTDVFGIVSGSASILLDAPSLVFSKGIIVLPIYILLTISAGLIVYRLKFRR